MKKIGLISFLAITGFSNSSNAGTYQRPLNTHDNTQYFLAMGKSRFDRETTKQSSQELEQILRNTQKSLEKLERMEENAKQPPWFSGFLGYLLAVGIGVGSLFGVDMYRRYRTAIAYNKAGEEYFTKDQLDLSIMSFEKALAVDPGNLRSRYNLVESLIRLEDNLITSKKDMDQGEIAPVSVRLAVEIEMLKKYRKKDFIPYMLEAYWLQMQGKRESNEEKQFRHLDDSLQGYIQAIEYHKVSDLYYYAEVTCRLFKHTYRKLNQLYRGIGTLEKNAGNYHAALKYLIRAQRYNRRDKETMNLLKDCLQHTNKDNI